jgi:hypothetical protein
VPVQHDRAGVEGEARAARGQSERQLDVLGRGGREALVEPADVEKGVTAKRGGAGIDEVHPRGPLEPRVLLLELELRETRDDAALIGVVAPLHADDGRIVQRRQHLGEPAALRGRVGVQEHEDRAARGARAQVARRRWPPSAARQHARAVGAGDRRGVVGRTVVHDDQLGSPTWHTLVAEGGQAFVERPGRVVRRDHDASFERLTSARLATTSTPSSTS